MQGRNSSGPDGEVFGAFFAKWLERVKEYRDELQCAMEADAEEEQIRAIVQRFAAHYSSYYTAKYNAANINVLEVLVSPAWKTSLEAAFMWIGGWRPSLVFRLAYAQAGQEIETELAELMSGIESPTMASTSIQQLEAISTLQTGIQEAEDHLTEKMASIQQGVANQPLVGLVLAAREGGVHMHHDSVDRAAQAVEKAVDKKLALLRDLLMEADGLRSSALTGLLSILTTVQGAQFLVLAAHLQLTYRDVSLRLNDRLASGMALLDFRRPSALVLTSLKEHYGWCSSSVKFGSRAKHFSSVQSLKGPDWLASNEEPLCILDDSSTSEADKPAASCAEGAALYTVQLVTSNTRNSSFSEADARLRFGLIGGNGGAIMKQVITGQDQSSPEFRKFQLQSGDIDTFRFTGPDLGRIAAMWIAPQTGTWRLEEARVSVTYHEEGSEAVYVFKGSGELLGDGGDTLAVELRPLMATSSDTAAADAANEKRKQGMQEYESLKSTLLAVDALLVIVGTGLLTATGFRDAAAGFSTGGAGGFLYLFLLERAVDRLSPPDNGGTGEAENGRTDQGAAVLTGWKGTLVRSALVLGFVFIAGKALQNASSGSATATAAAAAAASTLAPQQLLAGAAGFFMFRIAVLLAGFFILR